ncbi:MAG: sulfatase-like hydrolase/transferase [Armatimonadia bacterium]|nr:sulfatase-like hydrolase/transferase [Armatimonadia bacterium]
MAALGGGLLGSYTGGRVAGQDSPPARRHNVLLICVDDLRPELGCAGATYADTPNIDRLAATGVRFTRHYAQVPTCGASRAALLMGRSPARSGIVSGNNGLYQGPAALSREPTAGAQTIPELFRRSGHRTTCIGKISHMPDGRIYAYDGSGSGLPELPHAWDELATPYGPWERGWGCFFAYADGRHREDGQGHQDLMEFAAEDDEDLPDGMDARAAVEKLHEHRRRGEAFFLGFGVYKPHLPFVATHGDWAAMEDRAVPLPPHPERPDSPYWHPSGEFYRYDMPFEKQRPLSPEATLRAKRAYLAAVRYADRQIGKVLDTLDELGLAESTTVVLWGDHGWHLGDSQIWGKHTPFERALLSPLIIRSPGMTQGGVCDALVETLDIYPTLRDLCDPSFPRTEHPLDGESLVPLLRDPSASVRDTATSYWGKAVTVRGETHRAIAQRGEAGFENVELYDVRDTVDPVRNLAGEQPEVAAELLASLPAVG